MIFGKRGVTHVLVGCHSASSALEPDPETGLESFGRVSFESIIPAAVRIACRSKSRILGVIGGERTIQSGVYAGALQALGKHLSFCAAQPLSAFKTQLIIIKHTGERAHLNPRFCRRAREHPRP